MSLYMSTAPHVRSPQNTRSLMGDVLIALAPTTIAGIYFFGVSAAIVVALATASAILFEYLWQKLTHKTIRIGDLSAAVTGLLVGLNLPPTAPWWLPIIGSGLAIILVKQLFGGIGDNFVNPALAARGILLASWPVRMTAFVLPTYFSGAVSPTPSVTSHRHGSVVRRITYASALTVGRQPMCLSRCFRPSSAKAA